MSKRKVLVEDAVPHCLVCEEKYGKGVAATHYAYIGICCGPVEYQEWNPVCGLHRHSYPAFRLVKDVAAEGAAKKEQGK